MRVYVPYGQEWYPYFMRRLAERPANVLFVLGNLVRTVKLSVALTNCGNKRRCTVGQYK